MHSLVLTDPLYVELRYAKRYPMATFPICSSAKSTQPLLRNKQAPDTLSNGWVPPRKHHNIDTAESRDNTFIGLRRGHPIQLYFTLLLSIEIRGNVPVQKYTALRSRRNALLLMPTSGWNGLFDLDLLWLSLSASAVRINTYWGRKYYSYVVARMLQAS